MRLLSRSSRADFRSGLYPKPLPYTAGQDAVGELVSLPANYTPPSGTSLPPLKVGQTVISSVGSSFAEYVVAPLSKVIPLPEGIDEKEAVGLTTTALTAVGLVNESYKVKKGDWVLVRAASGGVDTLLVQASCPCDSRSRSALTHSSLSTPAPT